MKINSITYQPFELVLKYACNIDAARYTSADFNPESVDLKLIYQAIYDTCHPALDVFPTMCIEELDIIKNSFYAKVGCLDAPTQHLTGCLDIIRHDFQALASDYLAIDSFDRNHLLTEDNVKEVSFCNSLEEVKTLYHLTVDEFNKRVICSHMTLALIQDVKEIVLCPTYDNPERFAVILKDSAEPFKGHKSFIFNDLYELDHYLSTSEESNELPYTDEIADACRLQDKLDLDIGIYLYYESDLLDVINNTAHPDPDMVFSDIEIEDGYICTKFFTKCGPEYQVFETIDQARNYLGEHSDTWKPEIVKPEEIFRKIGWEDEVDLIRWTGLTLEDYNRQLVMSFIPIKALNLIKSIDFRNFEIVLTMKNRHILTFETLEECKEFFQNAHDLGTLDLLENSMKTFMNSLERERAALKTAEREISEERKIQKKALSKIDNSKELKGAIQKLDKVKDSLKRLGKDSESTVQEIKEIFKK